MRVLSIFSTGLRAAPLFPVLEARGGEPTSGDVSLPPEIAAFVEASDRRAAEFDAPALPRTF